MNKKYLLNTRPVDQSLRTRTAFEACGFTVIDLPCIEISAAKDVVRVQYQMQSLSAREAVIFTSQYAVRYAFSLCPQWHIDESCQVMAVGSKTAEVLEHNYSGHIWVPEQQNALGIIELLKGMNHKRPIKLISAPEGTQYIQQFAKDQDLPFEQINVYQRQRPQWSIVELEQIKAYQPLYVIVSSVTTLRHLFEGLPKNIWHNLLKATLICASSRIVVAAQNMGFEHHINASTANPDAMARYVET